MPLASTWRRPGKENQPAITEAIRFATVPAQNKFRRRISYADIWSQPPGPAHHHHLDQLLITTWTPPGHHQHHQEVNLLDYPRCHIRSGQILSPINCKHSLKTPPRLLILSEIGSKPIQTSVLKPVIAWYRAQAIGVICNPRYSTG